MCSVITADSGRIYHQAVVDKNTCENQAYISRIALNIARQFKDPNAKITCCTSDGCNWSWSTANNNQALGSITTTSDVTLSSVYIWVTVVIFALIFLGLLVCFVYYWIRNKEESEFEEAKNDNILNDRYYR